MRKRRICISIFTGMLAVWIFAVMRTNLQAERPVVETYSMQETVEYGENYFRSSGRISAGYSVTVLSAKIVPYAVYAERYQIDLSASETDGFGNPVYRPEYVYDIEVRFSNAGNETNAIDMFDTLLVNGDILRLRIDEALWDQMYPQLAGSYSFRLRPNTEMVFHLPFVGETLYEKKYTIEQIQREKMSLVISQYPVKKMIELD